MKKIKIFHDNIDFIGGGERLIINLAVELKAEVYCYNFNPELNKYIKKYNLKIHSKKKVIKNNFLLKIYSFFYFLFLPLSYNSEGTTEIYSGNFSFLSSFFSKSKKIFYCHCPPKFIIYYKDIKKDYNLVSKIIIFIFRSIYVRAYKYFLRKTDIIIANSQFTKNRLKTFTSKSIKIVNPPNTFKVNHNIKNIKYSNYFLSNARLDKAKNIFELIYAFEKIKEKKLIICNDGELKNDIQNYIYTKKIKNIFYINYLNDEEYISLLSSCIAVIYIPSNEDYGMTVKESFYFGKSVIILDSGYLPELVSNKKNGLILKNLNVNNFKKVILNTSLNDFKKMGKYAKKTYNYLEKNNQFYRLMRKIISSTKS